MKKTTMNAIVNYLSNNLSYADEEEKEFLQNTINELTAELNKGADKAQANRELYAEYRQKVLEAMRSANVPVTAQDLAKETGIARGKIVYGLTNYWCDEVIADKSGKTTTYRLA